MLDRAWELGETFWDTAAGYGDNEELLGRWFKQHPERRKDIFLATKFGIHWSVKDDGKIDIVIDSRPETCRASCEARLRKLGVNCIDLFYVHRFDTDTPVEKIMEVLVQLKK